MFLWSTCISNRPLVTQQSEHRICNRHYLNISLKVVIYEILRISSHVLLSTLAIPIPVALSDTEKYIELDEAAREKKRRLAALLGSQTIPTRETLIQDMVRTDVAFYDRTVNFYYKGHCFKLTTICVSSHKAQKQCAPTCDAATPDALFNHGERFSSSPTLLQGG